MSADKEIVPKKRAPLADYPAFHLIYLVFYFFPWLFQAPTQRDVIAIVIALIVFIPLYFHAFNAPRKAVVIHIGLMTLIGFAVSPFFGSHGVFHIYACAQAGFSRPRKRVWITIWLLTALYLGFSLIMNAAWWDVLFPVFVALMVGAGTAKESLQLQQTEQIKRSNEYDQQMAKLAERERIARDLHDLLGQTLTLVALKSDIAQKLLETDKDRASQEIKEIRLAAQQALKDVRQTVSGMNRTDVASELVRAHKILSAADVELSIQGALPKLSQEADHVLGLTLREAVTNIVRHSNASKAILRFDVINSTIRVDLSDNGDSNSITEGSGLSGVRKRIADIGGTVMFNCQNGMHISLTLPKTA